MTRAVESIDWKEEEDYNDQTQNATFVFKCACDAGVLLDVLRICVSLVRDEEFANFDVTIQRR